MDIIRFLKDWTLPVAMGLGILLYLIFAYIPGLEGAATFFDPIIATIFPLFMFLVLFVTFCKVDFRKLRPVGWHFWVAVFQLMLVAVIIGLILVYEMTGKDLILMEALLTCIIAPTATAAAVVTQKLGGNLEEMASYTFISNFITALLIPICFPMIDKSADITFVEAFLKILYEVCILLLGPMMMAFIVKHFIKPLHQWIISVRDLSFYLWGCSLMIVTGTTVRNICHADTTIPFLMAIAFLGLIVCIIQFAVGRWIGHYFNSTVNAGQALGQKNTAFAIWIAYTYLTPLSSVGPGCYILWQNIINSIEIWQERKRGKG